MTGNYVTQVGNGGTNNYEATSSTNGIGGGAMWVQFDSTHGGGVQVFEFCCPIYTVSFHTDGASHTVQFRRFFQISYAPTIPFRVSGSEGQIINQAELLQGASKVEGLSLFALEIYTQETQRTCNSP